MPNFDPIKGTMIDTPITNGEINGQPTEKKTGFWGKIGGMVGTVAKVGIGIATGGGIGGIGGILPNLMGSKTSYLGQLELMHQDNMRSQGQLIMFQNKVQRASEEFAAISNLLKTRHDSEMQAVNNMKS
jgi:hypothetical protein